MMNRQEFRSQVLFAYGASLEAARELLAYNASTLDNQTLTLPQHLPLAPELHVETWTHYAAEAQETGVFATLKSRLVQLNFPIRKGISRTKTYQAATRRGVVTESETAGLELECPEMLELRLHESLIGTIPVLITTHRPDFVSLLQALTKKNEPEPIPDSMGACIVAGYVNWDRIRALRQCWEAENLAYARESRWQLEFQWQILPYKQLYQDTFLILSDGPYSNVPAQALGLSEETWQQFSRTIRLEHECTHYLTRRLFHSMRNNLLDELIADYRGIVVANGRYRADRFLHFMGLEAFPDYRVNGRLQNYRGQPPLSDEAFAILQALVKDAATNLEHFHQQHAALLATPDGQFCLIATLLQLTLEELSSQEADNYIQKVFDTLSATTKEL